MSIDVRLARSEDAASIAVAHVEAWRVAYRGIISDDYLDSDAMMRARMEGWTRILATGGVDSGDPLDTVLVPVFEGRVVGFANFGSPRTDAARPAPRSNVGELHGFYLHPDVWGQGVADALISQAHRLLSERFDSAFLWVLSANLRARHFYERSGWSCGIPSDWVTETWNFGPGSMMTPLAEPVPEIQYRIMF